MIDKVLIANRGVAAVRIAQTLRGLGITSVGLRSAAERGAAYFANFDEVVDLDGATVAETYLDGAQVLTLATEAGAQAIHPGYGFLSENAEFARAVLDAGLRFIGPDPETIYRFGLKHLAREAATEAGVSLLPGSDLLGDEREAIEAADAIGYPVILKSTAGGGGIGMQRCDDEAELTEAFGKVTALASANFSAAGVYLEKFLESPRHVEVQVFGDGAGGVAVLGDRDCSLQRRNQKLIEECPAPGLPDDVRAQMHAQARSLAESARYASAGTVEFLYDPALESVYFLEVNTRLQVEHAVTELVYDVDLVEWMIRLADGSCPEIAELSVSLKPRGHAIQARLYAEDPYAEFLPRPGPIDVTFPTGIRVDSWCDGRSEVSHLFDPLLANVVVYGSGRDDAIDRLENALDQLELFGVSNRGYLAAALDMTAFRRGEMSTRSLAGLRYEPREIEILSPGLQTTVQSLPGRQGYWEVGVPPSGPMDDFSFRAGNRLLGNLHDAAGLEITFSGPTIGFRGTARCVVTGGISSVRLDDTEIQAHSVFTVDAGQVLKIGEVDLGMRAYLLIEGGLHVQSVLGSTATFTLGKMGGLEGRALRAGDVVSLAAPGPWNSAKPLDVVAPEIASRTRLNVLIGPLAAPDFLTDDDLELILSSSWTVHHNSSRTGVRLIGPQPQWARNDGGEAGLHPSNVHDNAYAFGALDFTGDMPVILGPDGPSLGGFVCPVVVIDADRWKLGQLRPGDEIRLAAVDLKIAYDLANEREVSLNPKSPVVTAFPASGEPPVLFEQSAPIECKIRRSGQQWLLVEIGPGILDLRSRLVVHSLAQDLRSSPSRAIVELTPGVRSLQIRFDPGSITERQLVAHVRESLDRISERDAPRVSSRVVRMPISWEDPQCQLAVERYMASVRADAPWCPDNVEFIRRINGLADKADVKSIVLDASYLVLGLGDVYLGAPVATPLDPRHRLVTTKYNPARTWTAENSVGIGGAYLCVYGMEGPGGYQFVGRTTPVWRPEGFASAEGRPWLLNHFDQLQFHEVDAQTLLEMREAAQFGAYEPTIEEAVFDWTSYETFLEENEPSIAAFDERRKHAFDAELERWKAEGLNTFVSEPTAASSIMDETHDGHAVASPMSASVWRIERLAEDSVTAGSVILILEAMKSEVTISAPVDGRLKLLVSEGQVVQPGQTLAVIH